MRALCALAVALTTGCAAEWDARDVPGGPQGYGQAASPTTTTGSALSGEVLEPADVSADVPSFLGAEGFGTSTPGGRGGRVREVTSLGDAGPGTLREALEARGPRIIVFRVGGTIVLDDEIDVRHPFVTVAGQSATGGGITLKSAPSNTHGLVDIHTHDVVLRFLRFRTGPSSNTAQSKGLDVADGSHHVVVDHCSFSWAVDENLTTYNGTHDITFSWNIVAEGLSKSVHPEGEHSRGIFMSGSGSRDVSAHHNLLAHNMRRNPEVNTAGTADIRNNLVYDWGTHATQVSDKNGDHGVNIVGNYYLPGPSTVRSRHEIDTYPEGSGMRVHVSGNLGPHRPEDSLPEADSVSPRGRSWIVTRPVPAAAVRTTSARQACTDVLGGAGARVPVRDEVDLRILSDVRAGRGSIIDNPQERGGWPLLSQGAAPPDGDHDGMPDAWESVRRLAPGSDDSAGDADRDGWSNVEEYLDELARGGSQVGPACPGIGRAGANNDRL